jgi:hypothetical protein
MAFVFAGIRETARYASVVAAIAESGNMAHTPRVQLARALTGCSADAHFPDIHILDGCVLQVELTTPALGTRQMSCATRSNWRLERLTSNVEVGAPLNFAPGGLSFSDFVVAVKIDSSIPRE